MPRDVPSSPMTGILPLGERHRASVLAHLLALGPADRALRFGHVAGDETIARYVQALPMADSLGIFLAGRLVGVAHLAPFDRRTTEFAISLEPAARGSGWGRGLMSASLARLAAGGDTDQLVAHYRADNAPMARLVRGLPRTTERDRGDLTARIRLLDWQAEQSAGNALMAAAE